MSDKFWREHDLEQMVAKLRQKDPAERLKIVWEWVQSERINFAQFKQLVKLVDID